MISNFRCSFKSKLTLLPRLPLHNVQIWNQDSVKVSVTVHGGQGTQGEKCSSDKKIIMHLGSCLSRDFLLHSRKRNRPPELRGVCDCTLGFSGDGVPVGNRMAARLHKRHWGSRKLVASQSLLRAGILATKEIYSVWRA